MSDFSSIVISVLHFIAKYNIHKTPAVQVLTCCASFSLLFKKVICIKLCLDRKTFIASSHLIWPSFVCALIGRRQHYTHCTLCAWIVHCEVTQFAWLSLITAHSIQMKMRSVEMRQSNKMQDLTIWTHLCSLSTMKNSSVSMAKRLAEKFAQCLKSVKWCFARL